MGRQRGNCSHPGRTHRVHNSSCASRDGLTAPQVSVNGKAAADATPGQYLPIGALVRRRRYSRAIQYATQLLEATHSGPKQRSFGGSSAARWCIVWSKLTSQKAWSKRCGLETRPEIERTVARKNFRKNLGGIILLRHAVRLMENPRRHSLLLLSAIPASLENRGQSH